MVCLLASCAPTDSYGVLSDAIGARDRAWVAVTRLGCLRPDMCSAYELVVYEDGAVHWDGHECVSERGRRQFRVAPALAVELMERLKSAGITQLAHRYNKDCSAHFGVTTLHWSRGDERHRSQLVHLACDPDANSHGYLEAMLMVDDIHKTTETSQWRCEDGGR